LDTLIFQYVEIDIYACARVYTGCLIILWTIFMGS